MTAYTKIVIYSLYCNIFWYIVYTFIVVYCIVLYVPIFWYVVIYLFCIYILVTLSRPDLVIINRSNKTVDILELTCSFERNILAAHQRKTTKYTSLKADIESAGFACSLLPFEIGSRGHVTKQTKTNLIHTFVKHKVSSNALKCIKQISKISLLCSFCIFHAYKQPNWRSPPFLSP